MNFLSHIFLSGNNTGVQIGNFIADGVKGNDYLKYQKDIQNGIILHREIDFFTDNHNSTKKIKPYFRKEHGLFSGIIVDLLFDHFLSIHWNKFSTIGLNEFINNFYILLENNRDILPNKISNFYKIMIYENWLIKYQTLEDLKIILCKMDSRIKISNMKNSIEIIKENYNYFDNLFILFWKDITIFTSNIIQKL